MPPPAGHPELAELRAKLDLGAGELGVAPQLAPLVLLNPPAETGQRRRTLVGQAGRRLPPHPNAWSSSLPANSSSAASGGNSVANSSNKRSPRSSRATSSACAS